MHERVIPRIVRPDKLDLSGLVIRENPEVYRFSSDQFAFLPASIQQVRIPSISPAVITSSYCFSEPITAFDALPSFAPSVVREVVLTPPCPEIGFISTILSTQYSDLTDWLAQFLAIPEIHLISCALTKPQIAGKDYLGAKEQKEQPRLDFGAEGDENCRHGMKKSWCAICHREATPGKTQSKVDRPDVFDLIFPFLQPDPGESLSNRMWFPEGCVLYEFQRKGIRFLTENQHALLADEMGLGKTIQAIVAARLLFRSGRISTALVVCPKSMLTDWKRTLWDWAPELAVIRVEGNQESRKQIWASNHPVHIVTYETLREDIDFLQSRSFGLCILDEGQKIKNPEAGVSKACKQVKADWRWVLTGTPLENKVEDLISLFDFIKPGLLQIRDAYSPTLIQSQIKPYMLRRRYAEHDKELKLPEKIHKERWLELLPRQRETYDRAEKEGIVQLNELGETVTVQHVFALITELKKICNFDPSSRESCKLEFITEEIEELEEQRPDEKVLVFSQYAEKSIPHLKEGLARWFPLLYTGSLSQKQRDETIRRFQDMEENKILLVSLRAGGQGLTLHRANHVYLFDLWWNPAVMAQAAARAYRIGQKRTVFNTTFLVEDTIEERIHEKLREKRDLFEKVIDNLTDEQVEQTLTEEELFGLFGLESPRKRGTSGETGKPRGRDSLDSLSPREFEEQVANLYRLMGYSVRLTQPTRDGGVDIYARKQTDAASDNLIIQCKHYPNRTVGVAEARELNGLLGQQYTGGHLVTSGTFSTDCREFCRTTRIRLIDRSELLGLLAKYKSP